ncbi:MAG: cytochrome c [Lewinellaceae bacterium]|nr:cytochrome c [Phaeodactylibacter sp.]MCB0612365.1 cytochrome c [Phaeodactylibacter sp.]MCB9349519.1 cytochrome c [Lewinellaceae bacterium]
MRFNLILFLFFLSFILANCESQPHRQGEILYQNFCANCHMDDGSGLAGNIPPLAQSDYVRQNQGQLACIIRYGMEGAIVVNGKTYQNPMAGIPQLSEFEIANIVNYINQAWENDYGYLQLKAVREALEKCKQ